MINLIIRPVTSHVLRSIVGRPPNARKPSFSPLSLFANGEQGAWYDPSDTTTLFQDSAGTTPVTASGQPVGLMLDKSKGLVRGSELSATGVTRAIGSPSEAATYDTATGTGTAVRTDAYNASYVLFGGLPAGRRYLVTVQNTGAAELSVRTNSTVTPLFTVEPSATVTARVETSGVGGLSIFPRTNGSSIAFVVTTIRELPGHHATQPTAGSRPIYRRGDSRGAVNLLRWSEGFSNAAWAKLAVALTPNTAVAPDGTLTAESMLEDSANNFHQTGQSTNSPAGTYTASVYAKYAGRRYVTLNTMNQGSAYTDSTNRSATFDLQTGTITQIFGSGTVATITGAGDGWYRLACTVTTNNASTSGPSIRLSSSPAPNTGISYSGDGTSGIYIWRAQLNLGPTALPYQRNDSHLGGVATGASTDLHWLETDGVDDGMVTGNIDFTGTDKVSVFAGVRKLSDAAYQAVAEFSLNPDATAGAFALGASTGATPGRDNFDIARKGSFQAGSPFVAPSSAVVSGRIDNSYAAQTGLAFNLRVNGITPTLTLSDTGAEEAGNYGNYPLYLFRRGGTFLPFKGWFYGLAITGRLTTDAETVATERFLAAKSAVVIP